MPGLLHHPLVACEGLDSRIVDVVRERRGSAPDLPRGAGWLFAEVTGRQRGGGAGLAPGGRGRLGALDSALVTDPSHAAALWRIREDGAGLAAVSLGRPAHAGWEDAAVPPDRLGGYLRDFDALLRDPRARRGALRPLRRRLRARPDRLRAEAAAGPRRVPGVPARGRRGWWRRTAAACPASTATAVPAPSCCPLMYSSEVLDLFGRVKAVLDPDDLLNPGVLVDPRPADADLRLAAALREPPRALRWAHDGGSVVGAVHRCTGVGKCVATRHCGGDVPVLPGHPRREGLHPRPGPGPAGDGQRHAGARRLALRRGARGARPVPVLQGLRLGLPDRAWTWRPTRPRRCTSATGAGCARAATTPWAGCLAGCGWAGRWPGCPAGRSAYRRSSGSRSPPPASTHGAASRCRRGSRCAPGPAQRHTGGGLLPSRGTTSPTWWCGPTPSPTTSPRRAPAPRSGSSSGPGCASG